MISITADFSIDQLEKDMDADLQTWFEELGSTMMNKGKEITDKAIAKARALKPHDGGGFGNISYNLRSSIGCGLFMGGTIKEDYFPFGKGDEGQVAGKALMAEVSTELDPNDIGLIYVAGEKYGVFVQAKGYDVTEMSWTDLETTLFK